uniref:POTRA domain-containing protein n=1 Tax=Dermonema virens TaxID=1077399 RepID=A0A1G4NRQ0_9FLOR|nr:Hypothetical protein ORF_4 [Dermonema virens]SCW21328.1 Hypothetical protein ORF_4 [Dermonema virens]
MRKAHYLILQNILVFLTLALYHIFIGLFFLSQYQHRKGYYLKSSLALAFQISCINNKPIGNNTVFSQEILVNGLNNTITRNRVLNLLNMHCISNSKKVINSADLNILFKRIQSSGLFKRVTINVYMKGHHQLVYFTLQPNPILKTITIYDYKNKLIGLEQVRATLGDQLGQPISFSFIQQKIILIKQLYIKRGFTEIHIKVKYDKYNLTNINIEIFEKLVNKISVSVKTYDNRYIHINNKVLSLWLKELLQVSINSPLNIHNLEQGLNKLQTKKMVEKCNYRIRSHNNGIVVNLSITPRSNRSIHLFSRKTVLNRYFSEFINSLLHYSSNNYLTERNLFYSTLSGISQYVDLQNERHLYDSVYHPVDKYDFNVYIGIITGIFNIVMNDWSLTHLMFVPHNTFGLKYYSYYLDNYCAKSLLNIKFFTSVPSIQYQYEIPGLYTLNKIISQICLTFFDSIDSQKETIVSEKYKEEIFLYFQNSLERSKSFSAYVRNEILNKLHLYQVIDIHQLSYNSCLLYNQLQLPQLNVDNLHSSLAKQSSFTKAMINNFYSFFRYQLSINLSFDSLKRSWLDEDKISIQFTQLVPLYKSSFSIFYYSQQTEYKFQKTLQLGRQIFAFFISYNNLKYTPNPTQMLDSRCNYIKHKLLTFYSSTYKLEYYIPLKNTQVYLFLYNKNNLHDIDLSYTNLINIKKLFLRESLISHYQLSYGIGFQLMIPIKQIPPLRIEYGYNVNNSQYVQLKVKR